jgi:hypothetical protein
MKTLTLTNSFHNTEARVRPIPQGDGYSFISRKTALRLRRELCGVTGCTCGGEFGQRGGKTHIDVINETSDRGYLVYGEG